MTAMATAAPAAAAAPTPARRLSAHARIQNAVAGTSLIGTTLLTKVTGLTATSAAASTPTQGSPVEAPT